jgi:cobalt/nickel transport system permease protein
VAGQLNLRDFLRMEESLYEGSQHGWRTWDARWKVGLSVAVMLSNSLWARARLSEVLVLTGLALLVYSRVSWKLVLLFLLVPTWAILTLVVGYAMGFGHEAWFSLGPLHFTRDGLALGLNAGLRVLTDVSWAALLMLTTPFHDILAALRWFKVPEVLVDTLSYMYRYVFLLFDDYSSMRASAKARGGFTTYASAASTSGQIAANIFLRSYDRAERISQAMRARGGE